MNHLGDITKIHGGTAPVVDVIIGGSPCQDLSIAGKRAGLAGERSGHRNMGTSRRSWTWHTPAM